MKMLCRKKFGVQKIYDLKNFGQKTFWCDKTLNLKNYQNKRSKKNR